MDLPTEKTEPVPLGQVQRISGSPSVGHGDFTVDVGVWLGMEGYGRRESTFPTELPFCDFGNPRERLGASGCICHLGDVGTPV